MRPSKPNFLRKVIVISASSDIGEALCHRWLERGTQVCGSFRRESVAVDSLRRAGVQMVFCDLSDKQSVSKCCADIARISPDWDALILCPGDLAPVGPFTSSDFSEWERSFSINCTAQLRIVHKLLAVRRRDGELPPEVLFFAGGGTNNATVNYSAYTLSKITLIKACELLDAEMPDVRFVILGPGWVRTKIHDATLAAGKRAGQNFENTKARLKGDNFVPMEKVLDCCDWLLGAPREVVGGRNFSTAGDDWGSETLSKQLAEDSDLFKLRRWDSLPKMKTE